MKTTVLTYKTIIMFTFLLFTNLAFSADTDGDGVTDATEAIDLTDPLDNCSYIALSVTLTPDAAWQAADCDGDGTPNDLDSEPLNPCVDDGTVGDEDTANPIWQTADCDGDGTPNGTDPDPIDPCVDDGIVGDEDTANPIWQAGDCDGDGTPNGTDPDPIDPCVDDGTVGDEDTSNPMWALADCDGDGVINSQEIIDGTDFFDPCDYVATSQTVAPLAFWNALDCDGDGVTNSDEIADGTDPQINCDYVALSQTVTPDAGWNMTDCDTDGLTNGDEVINGTDPFNPDTDGDGVLDGTEVNVDVSDPFDPCDLVLASMTLTPDAAWLAMDCDSDGITNGAEMAAVSDPLDPCDPVACVNTITGNVKLDYNSNGCDAADFPIMSMSVISTNGSNSSTTFTDINGDYTQSTNSGTITTSVSGFPSSYTSSPGAQTSTFTGFGNTDSNVDFCIAPAAGVNDLNVTVIPMNNPVPGNVAHYQIVYKNVGSTVVNGSVDFGFDAAKLTFLSSSVPPSTMASGMLLYNFATLNPYEVRSITISFSVSSAAAVGDFLLFTSQIQTNPVSVDATPTDNSLAFAISVSATLSSRSTNSTASNTNVNDMLILEGTQVEIQHAGEYLHYIIRFQNTSASQVTNLVITNELSDKLNWNSIELEKMSHNGQVNILDENQMTFNFNGINLPNSTTDDDASRGFIAFRIKPKSTVVVGDIITSQSDFYFDSNPVITTPSIAIEIVANGTASVNDNTTNLEVSVYPNPTKGVLNFTTTQNITEVAVYSKLGQLVLEVKNTDIQKINMSSLTKGVYFLKVRNDKGNMSIKKIVLN